MTAGVDIIKRAPSPFEPFAHSRRAGIVLDLTRCVRRLNRAQVARTAIA